MSVGGGFQPSAPTPSQPPQSQPQVAGDMMRHTGMGFSDTGMMSNFGSRPDMSMGFARNFQQPSVFNPFFGSYGAPPQYGMGGFGGGFGGGFNPMMGGIGGFGGYGGFGGMGGGFNPMMGGIGSLDGYGAFSGYNPMSRGGFGFARQQQFNPYGNANYQPPQQQQNALRQEYGQNDIQRQLSEQYTRNRNAGMSFGDAAKAQDELSNKLYSQYGIENPFQIQPHRQQFNPYGTMSVDITDRRKLLGEFFAAQAGTSNQN